MNNLCYHYERINNNKSLFPIIDCTYVIILKDSKYESRIREQMRRYPLSKNILLQWNKGYKNCRKKLPRQFSVSDLTDSYKTIFHNAIINDYEYIIILEEDFVVLGDMMDGGIREEIQYFLRREEVEMLSLGSVVWGSRECGDDNFRKLDIKQGTHAFVYKREIILYLYNLIKNSEEVLDMDIMTNIYCKGMYGYKRPLIIQVFSVTENQENWGSNIRNPLKRSILLFMLLLLLKIFGFNGEERVIGAYERNYRIHFDRGNWIIRDISNVLARYFNDIT